VPHVATGSDEWSLILLSSLPIFLLGISRETNSSGFLTDWSRSWRTCRHCTFAFSPNFEYRENREHTNGLACLLNGHIHQHQRRSHPPYHPVCTRGRPVSLFLCHESEQRCWGRDACVWLIAPALRKRSVCRQQLALKQLTRLVPLVLFFSRRPTSTSPCPGGFPATKGTWLETKGSSACRLFGESTPGILRAFLVVV